MSNKKRSGPKMGRQRTGLDKFGAVMLVVLAVCSMALFIRILATNMLTSGLTIALMVFLVALNGAHLIVQMPLWRNKLGKLLCGLLAIVLSAAMLYGVVAVNSVQNALTAISGKLTEKAVTAVIVLADDEAQDPSDTVGYQYGILSKTDQENTQALLTSLQEAIGTVETTGYESYTDMVDALYDDAVQAIVLNKGYIDVLTEMEGYTDFSQQTRIIYEFTTEYEVDPITPVGNVTKDPFIVYLSGIDARDSDINAKNRSDANLLAIVNPRTYQVLLLNTPRDTYLPLTNGEMDKLTHAGLKGIDESIGVLENLYNIEVSYYARINFNGLIELVDAVGGIDVYAEQAFTSHNMEVPGVGWSVSYSYDEGWNHLDGARALLFARERYPFGDGDNTRGRHQMAVIEALLDKLTSPAILTGFQDVLDAVSKYLITNMSYEEMSDLVQLQLKKMPEWNIQTYAITGEGDYQPNYMAGGDTSWVSWPDIDTVNTAKELIAQVLDGETITLPE